MHCVHPAGKLRVELSSKSD